MALLFTMLGALVPTLLISRLFLLATKKWDGGYRRVLLANGMSLVCCILIGGMGMADGGAFAGPQAFLISIIPQCFWLLVDLWRVKNLRKQSAIEVERILPKEPVFGKITSDSEYSQMEDDPSIALTKQSKLVRNNFFKRYWKGDVSLPISYWIVSWGTLFVILIISILYERFLDTLETFNPMAIFVSATTLCSLVIAISFWQVIGVLRSSLNHINNPKKLKIWGYLAIAFILLGVVKNYDIFRTTVIPSMISLYKIAIQSDPDIPSYKVTVIENGKELLIRGGIKHGLLNDLERALILAPSITTINLDSLGGRFGVAMDLYNVISSKGLDTVTNQNCLSACTMVFAAGKNRWIGINGRLGFHSGSFEGLSEKEVNEENRDNILKISREKNIPLGFFNKGDRVSSKEMWYPTPDELYENNFITTKISAAISSLKIMERFLTEAIKETKAALPKKLDEDTILIDVRVKLNRMISTHTLSKKIVDILEKDSSGKQTLKNHVIENTCKTGAVRDAQKIGVEYEYIYLHPKNRSKILTVVLPKCP
ncbi:MAG: hypothetical protein HOF21_14250 [Nitrospina sp.]|nr:hypothetical protein [Nitrospina sp.]